MTRRAWDSLDRWGTQHAKIAMWAFKRIQALATADTDQETEARIAGLSQVHKRHSDAAAWLMQFERQLALDIGGRQVTEATRIDDSKLPVLVVQTTKSGIASPH